MYLDRGRIWRLIHVASSAQSRTVSHCSAPSRCAPTNRMTSPAKHGLTSPQSVGSFLFGQSVILVRQIVTHPVITSSDDPPQNISNGSPSISPRLLPSHNQPHFQYILACTSLARPHLALKWSTSRLAMTPRRTVYLRTEGTVLSPTKSPSSLAIPTSKSHTDDQASGKYCKTRFRQL